MFSSILYLRKLGNSALMASTMIIGAGTLLFSTTFCDDQKTNSNISVKKGKLFDQKALKRLVGYKAVDNYVSDDMIIGLGTGSTAFFAVERVGQLLKDEKLNNIWAIPTSKATEMQALSLGIPLTNLEIHPSI